MGLGLRLQGRYPGRGIFRRGRSAEGLLQEIAGWFRENHRDVLADARFGLSEQRHAMAWLDLHPAEEEVELSVPATGVLAISARTSGAGPGYHAFLCHAFQSAGKALGIMWDRLEDEDETGYFRTDDRAHLESEMLQWLQAVCGQVMELQGEEYTGLQVSLPTDYIYEHDGAVATPLGPRDLAWLQRVAADPQAGIEHFPWWNEARDAVFYLNRALCRMWTAIRWREPLQDCESGAMLAVHEDLERAYRLDPSQTYPWREWRQILIFRAPQTELRPVIMAEAESAQGPLVGYRRRDVQVHFSGSGWSIEIPGNFAEKQEEDGRWAAWEEERTVWVSTYAFQDPSGRRPSPEESLNLTTSAWEGSYTEWRDGDLVGRARLTRTLEDGEPVNHLEALSAVPGTLAACNIFFFDAADRDWAVRTWQTLKHPTD